MHNEIILAYKNKYDLVAYYKIINKKNAFFFSYALEVFLNSNIQLLIELEHLFFILIQQWSDEIFQNIFDLIIKNMKTKFQNLDYKNLLLFLFNHCKIKNLKNSKKFKVNQDYLDNVKIMRNSYSDFLKSIEINEGLNSSIKEFLWRIK
ncbi:hypothetical protein SAMN02745179_00046 [Mycoplasmopsis agassizii]|uniref:Uncharacterized protein n=1 Tax=Mycoplasmopsis agassizii TaxID=33922 RepID=A0ABX4H5U3_9BACT|nr:hypothetical protein CJF60_01145 [Mycoplasmopsis agassizii]SMC15696.1 hypothetical protein SAMN02745179_00046 [Mycoplasmopsis agassizii]